MVTSGKPVSRSKTSARGAGERASSCGGTAVTEMLEADEGEDGRERRSSDPDPGGRIAGGRPDLRKAGDDVGAVTEAGHDDQDEAADFDEGHDAGERDRLNRGEARHGAHREHDAGNDPRHGDGQEHRDIAGAADADRRGRYHGGRNDEKPDAETEPVELERRMHIGRLAGADRHPRSQFGERRRAKAHDDCGRDEGERRVHAAAPGGKPDQNVDAGADGDTEPVEHRMRQRERANQALRRLPRCRRLD
jgi:hypothetical protein